MFNWYEKHLWRQSGEEISRGIETRKFLLKRAFSRAVWWGLGLAVLFSMVRGCESCEDRSSKNDNETAFIPGNQNPLVSQLRLDQIRVIADAKGNEMVIMPGKAYEGLMYSIKGKIDQIFNIEGRRANSWGVEMIEKISKIKQNEAIYISIEDFFLPLDKKSIIRESHSLWNSPQGYYVAFPKDMMNYYSYLTSLSLSKNKSFDFKEWRKIERKIKSAYDLEIINIEKDGKYSYSPSRLYYIYDKKDDNWGIDVVQDFIGQGQDLDISRTVFIDRERGIELEQ